MQEEGNDVKLEAMDEEEEEDINYSCLDINIKEELIEGPETLGEAEELLGKESRRKKKKKKKSKSADPVAGDVMDQLEGAETDRQRRRKEKKWRKRANKLAQGGKSEAKVTVAEGDNAADKSPKKKKKKSDSQVETPTKKDKRDSNPGEEIRKKKKKTSKKKKNIKSE